MFLSAFHLSPSVAGTFNIQRSTLNLLKKRHAQIKAKANRQGAKISSLPLFRTLCSWSLGGCSVRVNA